MSNDSPTEAEKRETAGANPMSGEDLELPSCGERPKLETGREAPVEGSGDTAMSNDRLAVQPEWSHEDVVGNHVNDVTGGTEFSGYYDNQQGLCVPPDSDAAKVTSTLPPAESIDRCSQGANSTATNADRTRTQPIGPYARAGVTGTGDTVYAGVAAAKGRDASSGAEADLLSASGQVGGQTELQVGMARVGFSSDNGVDRATMEVFTARAWAGVHNTDGSVGINFGVNTTIVGIEGTTGAGGGGLSFGGGIEASIGLRDSDCDGKRELCVRFGKSITGGVCIERPF